METGKPVWQCDGEHKPTTDYYITIPIGQTWETANWFWLFDGILLKPIDQGPPEILPHLIEQCELLNNAKPEQ